MIQGTPTNWTIGGAPSAPLPRKNYQEVQMNKGRFKRRGRVIREDDENTLLVDFYTTGQELVKKSDVTLSWRYPSRFG